MMEIEIPDKEKLEKTITKIKTDGPENLHILTDFDRTLTHAFVNGKLLPAMIAILFDEGYLAPDYSAKAQELYSHYYPIEIDPKIPKAEKKAAMAQWWRKVFKLLFDYGLTKDHVEQVVKSGKLKFRAGVLEFVQTLHEAQVPIVIMSSSGLGGDAIKTYLEQEKHLYNNIHIIGNEFIWDEQGKAVGVQEPIIHGMNKDETAIQNFPVFQTIKNRKNVILIGDSQNDVGMVEGFDYKNLIKIGFLNTKVDEHLPAYKEIYDLIILNDGTFAEVNNLLKQILS
ncbi:MAG: haloacid dehalogenase-like hydrolase [Patescibacteria group bacterium]